MRSVVLTLVLCGMLSCVMAQFGNEYRSQLSAEELPSFDCLTCVKMIQNAERDLLEAKKRWKNTDLAIQAVMEGNPCDWEGFKPFKFETSGLVEACWDNFYKLGEEIEEILAEKKANRVVKFCTETTSLCDGIDIDAVQTVFLKAKDEL